MITAYLAIVCTLWASHVVLLVKNPPANEGDIRAVGSIPGLGRSLGGRYGYPHQYSCLENSRDGGSWQATVHGVPNSWTQLSAHTHSTLYCYFGLHIYGIFP